MTEKPPRTTAEHIELAKAELASDEPERYAHLAIAHALVAIAEIMATNITDTVIDATARGALAATEAFGSILSVVNPAAFSFADSTEEGQESR